MLSGGGCLMLPTGLGGAVARGFALLDASTDVRRRSKVPPRKAGQSLMKKLLNGEPFGCKSHESKI